MHVRQPGGGIFKLHDYPVFLVGPHHSRNVMRVNLKFIYHTPKKKQQKKNNLPKHSQGQTRNVYIRNNHRR